MSLLLLLLLILIAAEAKVVESSISVQRLRRSGGWFFLARTTLSPGTSQLSFETRLQGIPFSQFDSIELALIQHSQWDAEVRDKCSAKPTKQYIHPILFNGDPTSTNINLTQKQVRTYNVVVRDCDNKLINESNNHRLLIPYKLIILNNGGQLSHGESYYQIAIAILLTAFLVFKAKRDGQKTEDPDHVQVALVWSLAIRALALFWKGLFVWFLWKKGSAYYVFQFFYLALHSISENIILALLLFMCFGWSISYSRIDDQQMYIPVIFLLSLINTILSVLGMINETEHDKFHMFDSIPGVIQIVFKVLVAGVFCTGILYSWSRAKLDERSFLFKFMILGVVYILSMPLICLICKCFVPEAEQESRALFLNEISQLLCNIIFTYNLTVKKSAYRSVSQKNTFLPSDLKRF